MDKNQVVAAGDYPELIPLTTARMADLNCPGCKIEPCIE